MFNEYDVRDEFIGLYLEIMEGADRMGDKPLGDLVRRKLRVLGAGLHQPPEGCRIIPFPGCFAPPVEAFNPPLDWPPQDSLLAETFHLVLVLAMGTVFFLPVIRCWIEKFCL